MMMTRSWINWSIHRKLVIGYIAAIVLAFLGGAITLSAFNIVEPLVNPFSASLALVVIIGLELVLVGQLRKSVNRLEEQMIDRSKKIEVVIDISQRLSAILDLNTLMQEVVTIIKEMFDYYHVHIYLLDEQGEFLYVAEGYGLAGAELKRRRHKIPVAAP
ncbi:MAG TPA: hypothetical protein VEC96_04105, partial [Anaerolineae bacterium]|nr:hypothetical protein [Anaerolineae bacterium]